MNRNVRSEKKAGATMSYTKILELLCDHLQPKTILEFGSGQSTKIFARYGKVTAVEYNPPGDYYGVGPLDNVTMQYIDHEDNPFFPRNLMEFFFTSVLGQGLQTGEDPLSQVNLSRGSAPKWDLAYIDGAVYVKGFVKNKDLPGWAGGDISYITRATLAGMCLSVCKYVLLDDVPFLPMLDHIKFETLGNRFCLITPAHGTNR
jgi:hypothetical protein